MFSRNELFELFRRRAEFEQQDLTVLLALIELGEQFRWRLFFMTQKKIAEQAGIDDTLAVRDAVNVAVAVGLIVATKVSVNGYSRFRYDFEPALKMLEASRVVAVATAVNVVSIADYRRRRSVAPRVVVNAGPVGDDAA